LLAGFECPLTQLLLGIETNWLRKWESYKNLFRNETVEFFDLRYFFPECRDGFDLIIGNPPYVQLQKDGGKLARLYEEEGYQTFERTGDIYCLFYERGWQLLKDGGCLCYITSNKWMRASYGESLRTFFLQNTQPLILIDFGDAPIFANATTYTNILLFIKTTDSDEQLLAIDLSREHIDHHPLPTLVEEKRNSYINECTPARYLIVSEPEMRIRRKIESQGIPLSDWDVKIYRGILTGLNEAFIIDGSTRQRLIAEDPKSAEIIKPILRGKDIKRYQIEFADLWIIFTKQGIHINMYPAIKKHLHKYYADLNPRNHGEKVGRKPGPYEWYEIQDNIAYHQEFENDKIIFGESSKNFQCVIDFDKFYLNKTLFFIVGESLKYISSFLNSKLFSFCFKDNFPDLQGDSRSFMKEILLNIPLKKISIALQEPFTNLVDVIHAAKNGDQDTATIESRLDLMIYRLYEITYEEALFIDPRINQLISETEYRKASILELSKNISD